MVNPRDYIVNMTQPLISDDGVETIIQFRSHMHNSGLALGYASPLSDDELLEQFPLIGAIVRIVSSPYIAAFASSVMELVGVVLEDTPHNRICCLTVGVKDDCMYWSYDKDDIANTNVNDDKIKSSSFANAFIIALDRLFANLNNGTPTTNEFLAMYMKPYLDKLLVEPQ